MEKNRHISALRKQNASYNIQKKIEILQTYKNEGVPDGAFVPRNLAEFRRWRDLEIGVTKIGSPNTLEREHNRPLKVAALEVISELALKARRKKQRSNEETFRVKAREKDKLITNLTNQWHASRHECERAQQNERRLKDRVAELQRDNGELTKKLIAIVPLQPA
jgi:hypothetical protein